MIRFFILCYSLFFIFFLQRNHLQYSNQGPGIGDRGPGNRGSPADLIYKGYADLKAKFIYIRLSFAKLYNQDTQCLLSFGLSDRFRRSSLVATPKIIHRMIFVCDILHYALCIIHCACEKVRAALSHMLSGASTLSNPRTLASTDFVQAQRNRRAVIRFSSSTSQRQAL